MKSKPFYTVPEVCRLLKIQPWNFNYLVRSGRIKEGREFKRLEPLNIRIIPKGKLEKVRKALADVNRGPEKAGRKRSKATT
jgi:hypothetical protein